MEYKYNMDYYPDKLLVRSGRPRSYDGKREDYGKEIEKFTYSRHFTYLFNVFVMMQLVNFFNARKLNDEKNIFAGLC